jgi:hypothetical protein
MVGGVGFANPPPQQGEPAVQTSTKKSTNFLRYLSHRKFPKASPTGVQDAAAKQENRKSNDKLQRKRSLSRSKSRDIGTGTPTKGCVDAKLAGTKTGGMTMEHKQRVLLRYPFLGIQQYGTDAGRNLYLCGSNSMCAEVLDMVTMTLIMDDNMRKLTHSAVERFFEWLPLFGVYLERYFFVEEDVLLKWLIDREGSLKGKMRASQRMMLRGRLQKMFSDLVEMQDEFPRQLPAGERIGRLSTGVHEFAAGLIEYFENALQELPPLINKHYAKSECSKLHLKWVKHVVEHIGTEDFLVLYTRWMRPRDLREWKTKVLLRTDFKFMAYSTWEKDMDYAHFQIVADFAETLEAETREDIDAEAVKHAEFMRHKCAVRQHLNPDDNDDYASVDEGEEDEDDLGEFEVDKEDVVGED